MEMEKEPSTAGQMETWISLMPANQVEIELDNRLASLLRIGKDYLGHLIKDGLILWPATQVETRIWYVWPLGQVPRTGQCWVAGLQWFFVKLVGRSTTSVIHWKVWAIYMTFTIDSG